MSASPWPNELILRVGIKNIVAYRRLPRATLSVMDWEGYTPEEQALIIELGTTSDPLDDDLAIAHEIIMSTTPYEDQLNGFQRRRVFTAAAWLAGASWNQLAALFKVSKSSIVASSVKLLPPNRQSIRLAGKCSLETIAAWLEWYKINWIAHKETPIADIATLFLTIRDD